MLSFQYFIEPIGIINIFLMWKCPRTRSNPRALLGLFPGQMNPVGSRRSVTASCLLWVCSNFIHAELEVAHAVFQTFTTIVETAVSAIAERSRTTRAYLQRAFVFASSGASEPALFFRNIQDNVSRDAMCVRGR